MVDVVPFSGFLYQQEKAGPADQLTAPPYDVISPQKQEELYSQNPYNVVRLILGKEFPDDDETNNRYSRSAEIFHRWIEEDILVQDGKPAFYVYSQDYTFDGVLISRTGFLGRVRLEEFSTGQICPHEFTLAKAKKDRSLLLRACRANFSPVFGLFSDPGGEIDTLLEQVKSDRPIAEVGENDVRHRLWRLQDEKILSDITDRFKNRKVLIADGHHRYETALAYYKEFGNEVKDSAHVMMFLTNLDAQSLAIYPIHRVVRCPSSFDEERFLAQVGEYFKVEPFADFISSGEIKQTLERAGEKEIVFCAYFKGGRSRLLRLKDTSRILPLLAPGDPPELQVLDVAQLHTVILKSILKIDTQQSAHQQYMRYKVNMDEARALVDSGDYDLAFFMNPTRIEQVRRLAEKGIRLPQKATFFYPKLLSGLVINKFAS